MSKIKKTILHVSEHPFFLNDIKFLIKNKNYEFILNYILSKKYSYSNLFRTYGKKFNYINVIPNLNTLQEKWSREFLKTNNLNIEDIFLEQVNYYKPDLIFFQSIGILKKINLKKLNTKFIFWDGTGLKNIKLAKKSQGVITNIKNSFFFYKKKNINCKYILHSFDPRINILPSTKKKYEIIFLGNIDNKNHFDRVVFLYNMLQKININFFIFSFSLIRVFFVALYNLVIKKKKILDFFKYLFFVIKMFKRTTKNIFGIKMYKTLASSKIVLNYHISEAAGLNMRVFETTGVGSCLLSDKSSDLKKIFKANKEIVTFKNYKDAILKIKKLLKDEKKIFRISSRGMIKCLKKHTFPKRINLFESFFEKVLLNKTD